MDSQTVRMPTELKRRLEDMKTHPRQPIYEVIERLLLERRSVKTIGKDELKGG